MIIYHEKLSSQWRDFGILVPLLPSRSKQVFDQLLNQGFELSELQLDQLPKIGKEDLLLAHSPKFIEKLYSDDFFEEFAHCFEILDEKGNFQRYDPDQATKPLALFMDEMMDHIGGTYFSMKKALENSFSYFLGGGMHHARTDKGAGFCLLNDIVIGIKKLQKEKLIDSCWVIDVDAHKGDGTAEMTVHDTSILTLSLHMEKGWPLDNPDPSHPSKSPSTIDIPINKENERKYNELLMNGLHQLMLIQGHAPDLIVVNNGSDPYEHDGLPSTRLINLTKDELLTRDQNIYNFCQSRNIPQCWLMSGGYGPKAHEIYFQFLNWVLTKK